jgi:hypothetical protein
MKTCNPTRDGSRIGSQNGHEESALPERSDKTPYLNYLGNSRGGTRTPDPGIMSAVL